MNDARAGVLGADVRNAPRRDGGRTATAGIAVFVKTPGRSPVKTRLAAAIGEAAARAWHERAAAVVAEVATAAARAYDAAVYFAVAEADAVADDAWAALPCLAQGEGGLGDRMGRVHDELVRRHGAAVLLGADAPQLSARALADALAWCAVSDARQAIGPARDGGFWLYASNRAAPRAAWNAVGYSRSDTGLRFRAAFASYGAWLELPDLTDVDRAPDLAAMRHELAALPDPTPGQRALGAWLERGALAVAEPA
jgi:glycosyltransferase A (GT-A) superfamily protein (DUF2064 family)